ncbi:hypothetical protein [Verminephrobacter eiseniae]|uniref:hypothetical protein n=1 Tax=Verminephrobacter eiseniae TaxID=364317 RepID=UPI0012EDC48A|nr:hypothetical protein [Verminephrobacter eiseniae]
MDPSPYLSAVMDACRKCPEFIHHMSAIEHRKEPARRSPGQTTAAALDAVTP